MKERPEMKYKISVVDACDIIHAPRKLKFARTVLAHLMAMRGPGVMTLAWISNSFNPHYVRARLDMLPKGEGGNG
jgi:hypothetical protein